jgi:hypothetical protein
MEYKMDNMNSGLKLVDNDVFNKFENLQNS